VQLLLSYGADVNQCNSWGRNCLMLAARANNAKVCKILLNYDYENHNLKNNNDEDEESVSSGVEMIHLWAGDNHDNNIFYFLSPVHMDKEIVQQIQIGISLADLWFVKRRQK
jgi:ankyrin repeat protein